jgi:hypothetical protein
MEIFGEAGQLPAINKQALGRIVAGFKRERGFISAATQRAWTAVHDAFTTPLQSAVEGIAKRCGRTSSGWMIQIFVGAGGVVGDCGPRTGNSSGV